MNPDNELGNQELFTICIKNQFICFALKQPIFGQPPNIGGKYLRSQTMSFRTEMLRFISQFTGTMSSTGNYRVKINHSKKVSDISCLGGCRPDYCQVSNKNFGTKLTSFMSNAVFLKPSCFFNIIS